MENEVTKGSNGQMNYTSGQGGGFWSYIDSLPLRYVGNRFYTGEYVADLEEENKTLKFQLQEIHQANSNYDSLTEWSINYQKDEVDRLNKLLDRFMVSNDKLQEENSLLKFQLQEIHQANINLFNESEKLKKEQKEIVDKCAEQLSFNYNEKQGLLKQIYHLEQEKQSTLISDLDNQYISQAKKHLDRVHELEDLNSKLFNKNQELESKIKSHELDIDKFQYTGYRINKIKELTEQLELKETINQDLAKKYQLLEEKIQVYDINMLELVEKHSKLEQDYNDLQGKYNILQEYAKNSSDNLFKVNLQHRVKPYLSEGVINVIVESNKEFN